MKREYQDFFCEEVRKFWSTLEVRPWGVWIREHAPIQAPEYALTTDVHAAWFLDAGIIKAKRASEYLRFYIVQCRCPWHIGINPPPSGIFRQGMHEIGAAGFAEVDGSDEYYFEWQFGGLFGSGDIYAAGEDGRLQVARGVYIS